MKNEEVEIKTTKKQWIQPDVFVLNAKDTANGYFEADYEDDRYTNPIAS